MKVLVIGKIYEESFANFIAKELNLMSHQVLVFDPGPELGAFSGRTSFYINRIRSKLADASSSIKRSLGISNINGLLSIAEEHRDTDLVIVTHDYLQPSEVERLKRFLKVPIVLWYPDPIWSFKQHMFLNANYDLLFFKDPYIVKILKDKINASALYMPECYSPTSVSSPVEEEGVSYEADITTAGNMYAFRAAFFAQLRDMNLEIKIWGLPAPRWMDISSVEHMIQNRFVAHGEKAAAFHASKIVLNNLNPAEIWGTNVRTFEICGAGAFQIVDFRPGLNQLFKIGEELVDFKSTADLKEKIRFYLSKPEERQRIAENGRARAQRDHSYEIRLKQLLDSIMGKTNGYPIPEELL